MPNSQNPLGALMPDEKKRELFAILTKTNTLLIEHDVDAELYLGNTSSTIRTSFGMPARSPKASHR